MNSYELSAMKQYITIIFKKLSVCSILKRRKAAAPTLFDRTSSF